ncbi:MAG TPA: PQQ-binding-like beta-propeller repeat protein [Thermoanaerobaculia bacterium]|nr:PQQ-binding-like beta-propeller repeat protein [Thermoanaerobaculia bacterium]
MGRISPRFFGLGAALLAAAGASAADWPGWRGPARDGRIAAFTAPGAWPGTLSKLWSVEVGEGHSSPVVAGGKVFVLSRQGEEERVAALSPADGRTLWSASYPAPYQMNPAAFSHGKGPKATPAWADGRLFTFGISGILSAFDAEKGTLLWRKDFTGRFKTTSPLYGTATSPLVDGSRVIVWAGGHGQGALLAFDAATGKELWAQPVDGPGYASPVVAEMAGVRQLVTQSEGQLLGISLERGEVLWQAPFSTEYTQNSVTPLVMGDVVIVSGLDKGLAAMRIVKKGAGFALEPVWRNEEVPLYLSSPVLAGDRVCGISHKRKGQLFCVDAKTGKTAWATTGRDGEHASILAAGDLLVVLTDGADLVVAKASGAAYQELARYRVADSATWAHPVVDGREILVKDLKHLARWRLE